MPRIETGMWNSGHQEQYPSIVCEWRTAQESLCEISRRNQAIIRREGSAMGHQAFRIQLSYHTRQTSRVTRKQEIEVENFWLLWLPRGSRRALQHSMLWLGKGRCQLWAILFSTSTYIQSSWLTWDTYWLWGTKWGSQQCVPGANHGTNTWIAGMVWQ